MSAGLHVSADRSRCIGAGLCVLTAPDVFEHDDDDGLVIVLDVDPPGELEDDIRQAGELCPAHAIQIAAGRSA